MINNLSQLKKTVQPGTRVLILGHCRSDYVGELREISLTYPTFAVQVNRHQKKERPRRFWRRGEH